MSLEASQHLLSGEQITPEVFERISETSERLQNPKELIQARQEIQDRYPLGAAALAVFVEPSARTRYSSLRASARLDIPIFVEANPEATLSLFKGESWPDTFLTFNALDYQIIFYRAKREDAALEAATYSGNTIITNCGDGKNQHPTQAILDAETIKKTFGRFDGLTIAYIGDPAKARTAHSLIDLLGFHDTHHIFSTHPDMTLEPDHLERLEARGISYEVIHDIKEAARKADILYMNRHQVERVPKLESEGDEDYQARLARKKKEYLAETQIAPRSTVLRIIEEKGVRVMHPWPRNEELPDGLTYHPQGLWIDQMSEGVNTRTATTYLQLTGKLFEENVIVLPSPYADAA